jgi:MerR family mercuric resistance operon transcriptional regulator
MPMNQNRTCVDTLTIGKLAKAAHVNIETIRYYQRVGLITEPEKPSTGYRLYPITAIARINFIKRAQQLGFTLKQIHELLQLGEGKCQKVQALGRQKLTEIEDRINDLRTMQKSLIGLLTKCRSNDAGAPGCALVEELSKQLQKRKK